MKDDYLWDRSGEPDAEVLRLERTLGRLRHRPRPLELPRSRPLPRWRLHPTLAAAAVLVLMLLGAGVWLALHRSADATTQRLIIVGPRPVSLVGLYRRAESFQPSVGDQGKQNADVRSDAERASRQRRRLEAGQAEIILARRARERREERMMRESEEAAEKLMLALRYASSKLNLVQRQIQVNKEHGPAS
ncbi:MAG TPA: hypothetical protein VF544_06585 [Pyrinomonadaceae bacterium]|jgi:hypothetical protein